MKFTQEEIAKLREEVVKPHVWIGSKTMLAALDEIERLRELLWRVLGTCLTADETGDLPEIFDGALLDEMGEALKGGGDE